MNTADAAIVDALLKSWQKTVDVQMHFNDMEMRIRNLAVTIIGALAGLAGVSIKLSGGSQSSVSTDYGFLFVIIVVAIVVLVLFYMMDRFWYHRLLYGAVKAGQQLERHLAELNVPVILTDSIGSESRLNVGSRVMRSTQKIDVFYGGAIILLLCLLGFLVSSIVGILVLLTSMAISIAFYRTWPKQIP